MRKAAQIGIGLVISLLALWLAFRGVDLGELAQALREANYLYLVPAAALIWLGLVMRALSWRIILGGQVPFRRVYDAMNEGYLLNNLLPFRLGEFGRAYLVSRGTPVTTSRALSSVVVERVIDLLMLVLLLATFLPLVTGLSAARGVAAAAMGLGLAALVGLGLVVRFRALVLRLARAALARPPLNRLHPERWLERIDFFLDGLAVLQDPRRAFWTALWSVAAWVSAGAGVWMLLLAFIPDARPGMGFFVLAISGLGIAVPSLPGAAGVFEFAVIQALSVFGFEPSRALGIALVYHLTHIGLTSALGGLALAREGETLGHLFRTAQAMMGGKLPAASRPARLEEADTREAVAALEAPADQ